MTDLVLALGEPGADSAAVGGKGASLMRMAAAGLPVPPGFCVTTAAYLRFATGSGVQDEVVRARAAMPEATQQQISELFTRSAMPEEIAGAIRAAYSAMGGTPVAVRSSATAEDLPEASFAGQHDTFLNVHGEEDLLVAVQRCWASLWTVRAIDYRARHAGDDHEARMAVIVQEMVPADCAGVLFTADPVTGDTGRIVINAAQGLGEALVAGEIDPDAIAVDRGSGQIVERHGEQVLEPAQVDELVGLTARIEALYDRPVDVEWAHRGRAYVLQARPITVQATEVWNDSLAGDYLWTSANLGEAMPNVMTPCTWSLMRVFMSEAMASSPLRDRPLVGNIGGRPYFNLSVYLAVSSALGVGKLARKALEQAFGRIPEGVQIPPVPMSRWQVLRDQGPKTVRYLLRTIRYYDALPDRLATVPQRCEAARSRIEAARTKAELAQLWHAEIEPLFREVSRMLAGARMRSPAMVTTESKLRKLVGEADANALLSGLHTSVSQLASLGPLMGLQQLSRGEIDRDTYIRAWGHRSPDEFEVSAPRPIEDPQWFDRQLASLRDADEDVTVLLARQEQARFAAWSRLRERHPGKVKTIRRRIDRSATASRLREDARSEVVRVFGVLRAFVIRAGELTRHGDGLFFLSIDEVLDVLDGGTTVLGAVPARRAAFECYGSLPAYPMFIRGRFDPFRWAADPNRRSDVYDEHGDAAPIGETLAGLPGAAGVAEGRVRVIESVDAGRQLEPGDILVTTVTNVGWTPLFPRIAAVVTDIGAPLSHAAIVARELGIPAVVGCGNATTRLRTGDRVQVDGARGTVEILAQPNPT